MDLHLGQWKWTVYQHYVALGCWCLSVPSETSRASPIEPSNQWKAIHQREPRRPPRPRIASASPNAVSAVDNQPPLPAPASIAYPVGIKCIVALSIQVYLTPPITAAGSRQQQQYFSHWSLESARVKNVKLQAIVECNCIDSTTHSLTV